MGEPEQSIPSYPEALPEPTQAEWLLFLRVDQRRRWQRGDRLTVRQYLDLLPQLRANLESVLDLISNEVCLRLERGEVPRVEDYLPICPEREQDLRRRFALQEALFDGKPVPGPAETRIAPSPDVANQVTLPPRSRNDLEQATLIQPPPLPTGTDNGETVSRDEPLSVIPADWPILPGYEILGVLGRGGMGVVYRARQVAVKRVVALKMISARAHGDPQELARFQTESEAVARLNHPNIVQIFDVGQHQGKPFFSLEYVDGGNLEKYLGGRPLPGREAAELVESLARAVDYAHQNDIIHRDLKPLNILLTRDGVPKITDFGLAKKLEEERGQTQSGAIVGTPSYMSPEQAAGKTKDIGPTADVYGLGAILYALLTGKPPFHGASPVDTILQVISEEPQSPRTLNPKVHPDLETICLRCLRKEPNRRYPSARALANDLRRYLNGEPVKARPLTWRRRADEWARAHPGQTFLGAALGLIMLVMCVVSDAHRAGLPAALLVMLGLARAPLLKFWLGTGVAFLVAVAVLMTIAGGSSEPVRYWETPIGFNPRPQTSVLAIDWRTQPWFARIAYAFAFGEDRYPDIPFWAALAIPVFIGLCYALTFRVGLRFATALLALAGLCSFFSVLVEHGPFFTFLGIVWGLVGAGLGRLIAHLIDRPVANAMMGILCGFLMCPSWQFMYPSMRLNVLREGLLLFTLHAGVAMLFLLIGGIIGAFTGPRLHPPPAERGRRRRR